ncbi:amidase domain-containing protein [Sporanaerobium hydrogeniformans]|uniref:amidase domain-containing protein n=1 Tax=Sporanaerobium hydrogeniformans TaxID=3072179 RepID=UPI0026D7A13F|nr:amidase domain-containing protein [Sporanaerobium hydrogeniformans]
MFNLKPYNRKNALRYAHAWSYFRNPNYMDFSLLGGDCTNFISQCLYAGCEIMNPTPVYGWYYWSPSQRTASWTGVKFLHKFLTQNEGIGPFGKEVTIDEVLPGDIIQLANAENTFYHSLLIVAVLGSPSPSNLLIATHTLDSDYRPLATYDYFFARFIHIEGIRTP